MVAGQSKLYGEYLVQVSELMRLPPLSGDDGVVWWTCVTLVTVCLTK